MNKDSWCLQVFDYLLIIIKKSESEPNVFTIICPKNTCKIFA